MSEITSVTSQDFNEKVLGANLPALVYFHATWSGPCKMCFPVLRELCTEYNGKALFFSVDVDEDPDLAKRYGVESFPTTKVFKKSESTIVGSATKEKFKATLDASLS